MAAGHSEADEARRKRLAAALRENLKRRKAQSRAVRVGGAAGSAAQSGDGAEETDGDKRADNPADRTET